MTRLIGATTTTRRERGAVLHGVLFVAVSALAGVLVAGLVIPVAGLVGVGTQSMTEAFNDMDATLPTKRLSERSRMFDANGDQLTMFYDQNRVEVTLDQVAPVMKDAVLAIEDDRFYEHGPMDVRGTGRAFIRNLQGGDPQGGSTITQQYVKQVLFTTADTPKEKRAAMEDSYGRKLQELRYAVRVEKTMSKDEILAGYLNVVYFGNSAYGVESAAKRYFDTSASKLTLAQAAMLAGLVRDPVRLNPFENEKEVIDRRNLVLHRMAVTGRISQKKAEATMQKGLDLNPTETSPGCYNASYAKHFCNYVYEWLLDEPALGKTREARKRMIAEGGLTIKTTVDPKIQKAARKAMRDTIYPTDSALGAMSMVEPGTGKIKAMVQSTKYGEGKGRSFLNYNVSQGDNGILGVQPGSTFKPFVLAAAIKQGIPLNQKIPAPSSMPYPSMKTCDGTWENLSGASVSNSTNPGASAIDAYTGAARSVNTFFVNLEAKTGVCAAKKMADKTGVATGDGSELQDVPSFVLGVNNVTPLSMAEAYATFAADGVHCNAVPVVEVLDRNGNPLPIRGGNCKQAVQKHVARGVNDVLSKVVDGPDPSRTGQDMSLADMGIESAGKTGTNDDKQTVSYVGYTTDLASFTTIANDQQASLVGESLGGSTAGYNEVWGGTLAGPIYREAMAAALEDKEVKPFTDPDPEKVAGTQITVPSVLGMSEQDAIATLENAGFQAYTAGVVHSETPKGQVAQQSPAANGASVAGGQVQIWISKGPRPQQPPQPPPNQCEDPFDPRCWDPGEPDWGVGNEDNGGQQAGGDAGGEEASSTGEGAGGVRGSGVSGGAEGSDGAGTEQPASGRAEGWPPGSAGAG